MDVDEVMKIYEQGGSEDEEKLLKMLKKKVDEALDRGFHQGMHHSTLFETLHKEKAILELHTGNNDKAIASFLESCGSSARQKFCSRMDETKFPQTKPSSASETSSELDEIIPKGFDEELINFSMDPMDFKQRLQNLPSDCVIVEISEVFPGQRQCPPEVKARPLCVIRCSCGENTDYISQCIANPHPLPAARNSDILVELKSIIKEHAALTTSLIRCNYKDDKLLMEERFQIVMEAVRDWLGPWRSMFLGRILDNHVLKNWDKKIGQLASKLEIADADRVKFSLLAQCSNIFTKVDLVQGLQKIIPKNSSNKAKFILDASKQMKKLSEEFFGTNLESFTEVERHPVILIADKSVFMVPWEQLDILQTHPISRMPSLAMTHAVYMAPRSQRKLDSRSAFFVVDPDKNLPATSKRLRPVLKAREEWIGTIAELPEKPIIAKQLQENDIYIYCGHGSGSHLIDSDHFNPVNSAAILMGCSSADINKIGIHWESQGAPLDFLLGGSPVTLGMLWIVTDTDTDKMTVRMLDTWLPPKDTRNTKYRMELCTQDKSFVKVFEDLTPQKGVLKALRSAQKASTSQIIASAFIAHGVPVYVGHNSK
ncbi:separin [Neocloeon triangulifer]|uniref:separin n=1 Tax=Neocloeon triangulifer TaxID=2078957 RepID=UPI00286EC026|nr:separin [Neocloeon triangulifer]